MGSIFESLGIEWPVVIAQALSFLVLLALLWRYLYHPVADILRQRQEQIANSLSGAEAQRLKSESLRKEYEAHLDNIAEEARKRLEQAMKDAEAARQRLLEQANVEVSALHQRHQVQLELDRERLRHELRTELSDIAVSAATKALRRQLTPDLQSAVIDQVIDELDQQSTPPI